MKAKKQKGFWKCEYSLINRFSRDVDLLLYIKLRCLAGADREGRIPMDTESLAACIKWKLEHLAPALARLMDPDPKSRCQLADGRTVAYIDPERPERGFWIPGVRRHRKRNADTERRRTQKAEWMKKNRPSRAKDPTNPQRGKEKLGWTGVDSGGPGVDSGGLPTPGQNNSGGPGVDSGGPKVDCDRRREKGEVNINSKSGGNTLQPGEGDLSKEIEFAKQQINKELFHGTLPEKNWTRLALDHLIKLLPLTKAEIFTFGLWWDHELDDDKPELRHRPQFGLEKILEHWNDLYTRAITFEGRHYPPLTFSHPNPFPKNDR